MEALFWLVICFICVLVIFFCATVFVYRSVFGYTMKDALKQALHELFFWRNHDNEDY